MKLCTRHKVCASILGLTLLLYAVLFLLGYDSVLTTYNVTNGVESFIYTPIGEAIPKSLVVLAVIFLIWEYFARRNDRKIADEPKLQSYRVRGFIINAYFFFLSLAPLLTSVLTLIVT